MTKRANQFASKYLNIPLKTISSYLNQLPSCSANPFSLFSPLDKKADQKRWFPFPPKQIGLGTSTAVPRERLVVEARNDLGRF